MHQYTVNERPGISYRIEIIYPLQNAPGQQPVEAIIFCYKIGTFLRRFFPQPDSQGLHPRSYMFMSIHTSTYKSSHTPAFLAYMDMDI